MVRKRLKTPGIHNHGVQDYNAEKFKLRAKCKTAANNSTIALRQLFDETTGHKLSTDEITFKSCESIMYRARRESQPRIPKSAFEFSTIIQDCPNFGQFYKGTVVVGENYSVILYSDNMYDYLSGCTNIYILMKHSKSVQNNFPTIFIEFGRHVIPAIHCLLTCKSERSTL